MIDCEGLVKIYKVDDLEVVALQGLNFSVKKKEMMAIIGNSGSGKSTLLNILGGLDHPSAGKVRVGEWNLLKMSEKDLVEYKRKTVGFVWQNNARNLIPYMSALENVEIPMILSSKSNRGRAMELLEAVGLKERLHNKLHQLSGGEQQRVAIAIALVNEPQILLADEPTGSVDQTTADMILDIFRQLNKELGLTIVIVTHDPALAKKVDRVIAIRDGMTVSEYLRREEQGEFDQKEESHEEFTVLDRAGRLQIPQDYREKMNIDKRVKMEFDGEKITIRAP